MEEKVIKGKVEAKVIKETKKGKPYYAIKVDGQFYNHFGSEKFNEGSVVELSLEKDGQYWNIKNIDVVSGVETQSNIPTEDLSDVETLKEQTPEQRKQQLIVRQSSMNYATQLSGVFYQWRLHESKDNEEKKVMDLTFLKNQVIALAGDIEKWINRIT